MLMSLSVYGSVTVSYTHLDVYKRQGTDRGVWLLVGNTFFPLQGADALASKRIRGIIPYKKGVLVVTAYNLSLIHI